MFEGLHVRSCRPSVRWPFPCGRCAAVSSVVGGAVAGSDSRRQAGVNGLPAALATRVSRVGRPVGVLATLATASSQR